MRFNKLFTIPEGTKVTEKMLAKVLVSSIFSILLCMVCLVNATWAWFTVSLENTDNVIQIAMVTADVEIRAGEELVSGTQEHCYHLKPGVYTLVLQVQSDGEDADNLIRSLNPVYVLLSASCEETMQYYFVTFENKNVPQNIQLTIDTAAEINFSVSWVEPASAIPVSAGNLVIGQLETEQAGLENEDGSEAPTETMPAEPQETVETEPTTAPSTEPETPAE